MNTTKILVCLYSDANLLSVNVLENLLFKNCYILVVTDDAKKWEQATGNIGTKSRFSFIKPHDFDRPTYFNYALFCGGFLNKDDSYKSYKAFSENRNILAVKKLAVFPFESFSPVGDAEINVDGNSGVIYLGDVFGPRMDLESDLMAAEIVNQILQKREIRLPIGEVLYPLFVADVAKMIAKWLFSFGPYGKEIILLGEQTSSSDFWTANKKLIGDVKLIQEPRGEKRLVPKNLEIRYLSTNLSQCLTETYRYIGRPTAPRPIRKIPKPRIKYSKHFWPVVITLLVFLLLPFFLIIVSSGLLFTAYKGIGGTGDGALREILIAKTLFVIGGSESNILSFVPGVGPIYREVGFASRVGEKVSDIAVVSIPALRTGSTLFNNILGDSIYDPSKATIWLSADFTSVYQTVSQVQAETMEAKGRGVLLAGVLDKRVDFDNLKEFLQQGKILADGLPNFLGVDKPKTYLLLFQNNVELRPTGGFIGSFGLLTFDGGRMSNLTVNDVYSADGQLRGHVEPPAPIKNYLGEANWWFRDSNWDPDFPTSAQRAEWFLGKEIDQQVDGVFAIDLKIVKDALALTGPIFLPDYNLDITSQNLYEKTQAEVQEEFFPGSHQKASFLTALSRNMVTDVEKISGRGKISILLAIFKNLEARHIQAFLHDDNLQSAVTNLNWGGEVVNPDCGRGCYADLVGITEANVGDNKANYFITRDVHLDVKLNFQSVVRRLTLNLSDSANVALGPSGTYKVYIRIFVPLDSAITSIKATSGDFSENLSPEITQAHGRNEVGVIAEVLGGTSKKIEFTWQTTQDTVVNAASYGLYIRKQAGVTDDPWAITVTPSGEGLTSSSTYSYNTTLGQDFFAKVGWLGK